jgi:hypothetical protein
MWGEVFDYILFYGRRGCGGPTDLACGEEVDMAPVRIEVSTKPLGVDYR